MCRKIDFISWVWASGQKDQTLHQEDRMLWEVNIPMDRVIRQKDRPKCQRIGWRVGGTNDMPDNIGIMLIIVRLDHQSLCLIWVSFGCNYTDSIRRSLGMIWGWVGRIKRPIQWPIVRSSGGTTRPSGRTAYELKYMKYIFSRKPGDGTANVKQWYHPDW